MKINSEIIPYAFSIIGMLVIAVQVTVEVIKRLPGLKNIPTDSLVIILSILYSEISLTAWSSIASLPLKWYLYVGAAMGGMFIAYVAMFGWKQLSELVKRYKR